MNHANVQPVTVPDSGMFIVDPGMCEEAGARRSDTRVPHLSGFVRRVLGQQFSAVLFPNQDRLR